MNPLIPAFSLIADIYAFNIGTGTRGPLLATNTQAFTDGGLAFYDVALLIALYLTPGNFYEMYLKPTLVGGFGFGQFNMEFYNFDGPVPGGGSATPYAAGPVTVFDGCGEGVGDCSNFVLAHFRLDADAQQAQVPEPSSLALLGLALAGFGLARRKLS